MAGRPGVGVQFGGSGSVTQQPLLKWRGMAGGVKQGVDLVQQRLLVQNGQC